MDTVAGSKITGLLQGFVWQRNGNRALFDTDALGNRALFLVLHYWKTTQEIKMELSVRQCVGPDEAAVEALPSPDSSTRRQLFGLTHTGALIETSQVTLCAQTSDASLAGFASFDDQIPAALGRWPEVRDYLKKRLQFGKPQGCVLLSAFRYDPVIGSERRVLVALLHELFKLQPELGGVVLAVHVGVDIEELGVFSHVFSCCDAVELSTGGLFMFYRAVRTDYSISVFVRQPRAIETEIEQIQTMVKKNEESKRSSWFDAVNAPNRVLINQDEHRACFVAQCVDTQQPCGLLACTNSIDTDQVESYALLFSEAYRKANPLPTTEASQSNVEPLSPADATPAVRNLTRQVDGPPNIIVLGPSGAGKGTQSQKLVQEFGLVYICTGDLLREAAKDTTGRYSDVNRLVSTGDLVPDEIVLDLVLTRLSQSDCKTRGWLLEGFPRTDTQARVLLSHGGKPDVVAILELSDDNASQRDEENDYESKSDNVPTRVSRKLALYREHREAVRQNFVKISTVIHVDAAKSRETTFRKLVHEIYRARGSHGSLRVKNPPRLIITGAPASGKGTQCELLVRALHVVHLSTGDMLRQAIRDGTSRGKQAQKFMDEGQLVPDELIVDVVLERLEQSDCKTRGWLLDGFPRTEAQAHALLNARIIPDCVLALDVPDEEVVKRIAGRRLDPTTGKTYHVDFNPPPVDVLDRVIQRSDDTEETVRTRLEQFHIHSKAVVSALGGVCELVRADGTLAVDHVADLLVASAERCLLRNNAAIISLFSMNSTHQSRASLFLAHVFDHYKDKDCVLLCLPENYPRPAITSGFRFVRGDPSISTITRLRLQEEKLPAKSQKLKKNKGKHSLLYVFHRDELPFLANYILDLSTTEESQQIDPVVVKGMGVKGFGLSVRSWTHKCFELFGIVAKKEKKVKPEASRARAATSESSELVEKPLSNIYTDKGSRNSIH